jgi:hypothetical protein
MKRYVLTAAAALLASTTLAGAQTQDSQPGSEIIKQEPAGGSAAGKANGAAGGTAVEAQGGAEVTTPVEKSTADTAQDGSGTMSPDASSAEMNESQASGETSKTTDSASGTNSDQVEKTNEASSGQDKAQDTDEASDKSEPSSETTASIDISTEQRTEIRNVIVETKAEPIDVDFEVNVGVVVPNTVTLRPLPPRVIEIVPAYSGYEYFVLADGRIIIVEPGTLKVVYVLVV